MYDITSISQFIKESHALVVRTVVKRRKVQGNITVMLHYLDHSKSRPVGY